MKYILISFVVFALSGCAALEQAPLVYTSKQVVGFDITFGAPESNISIGYTGTDAAYVPVAVSKDKMDKIVEISGQSSDGNSSNNITNHILQQQIEAEKAVESARYEVNSIQDEIASVKKHTSEILSGIDGHKKTLANYKSESDEIKLSISLVDTNILGLSKQIEELNSEIEKLTNAPAGLDEAGNESDLLIKSNNNLAKSTKEYENSEAKKVKLEKEYIAKLDIVRKQDALAKQVEEQGNINISENSEKLKKLDVSLLDAKSKLELANLEFDNVIKELRLDVEEEKKDAYSVYGKFNSGSTFFWESAAENTVEIGKVFSTGVASQHISQGIKSRAIYDSITKCLDALTKALKEIPEEKRSEKTLDLCVYKGNGFSGG